MNFEAPHGRRIVALFRISKSANGAPALINVAGL
jgi:hypothetical protein